MDTIDFLAVGDFGSRTHIRDRVVEIIDIMKKKLTAVLALGDNFYDFGVSSVHDPRWDEWLSSFRPMCPWYAVLGNHDYLTNPDAQVMYTRQSLFWRMPRRYYDKEFFFRDRSKGGVHIFFLDTFTLCPNVSKRLSMAMGKFSFEPRLGFDHEQLRWLDQRLSQSKLQWRVVVGHYPIFSNGHHGPTMEMVRHVLPVLEHHKVDFYLCGHDHDMECISMEDINFLVSGAGCSSNTIRNNNYQSVFKSEGGTAGVAYLSFHPNNTATFGFMGEGGKKLMSRHVLPRRFRVHYHHA